MYIADLQTWAYALPPSSGNRLQGGTLRSFKVFHGHRNW